MWERRYGVCVKAGVEIIYVHVASCKIFHIVNDAVIVNDALGNATTIPLVLY